MTKKRLSKQELHALRNNIPISFLIETVLDIPSRTTEGTFRFLCPLCSEFASAVNPKTNLARCFSCQKNFNTIDLVMLVKELDFLNAVRFLKNYRPNTTGQNFPTPHVRLDQNQQPQHIREILKSIVPPASPSTSLDSVQQICERILVLEQKLENLSGCVEELAQKLT
jgi:DNA primase